MRACMSACARVWLPGMAVLINATEGHLQNCVSQIVLSQQSERWKKWGGWGRQTQPIGLWRDDSESERGGQTLHAWTCKAKEAIKTHTQVTHRPVQINPDMQLGQTTTNRERDRKADREGDWDYRRDTLGYGPMCRSIALMSISNNNWPSGKQN